MVGVGLVKVNLGLIHGPLATLPDEEDNLGFDGFRVNRRERAACRSRTPHVQRCILEQLAPCVAVAATAASLATALASGRAGSAASAFEVSARATCAYRRGHEFDQPSEKATPCTLYAADFGGSFTRIPRSLSF